MRRNNTLISFFLIFLIIFSCKNRSNEDLCKYVQTSFYEQLNLNDSKFIKLNSDNNFIYYNLGYKGVVIYRASSTDYRVFERASPLDPNNKNAVVFVDPSGSLMQDTVHKQYWDMTGLPYSGASTCVIKQYSATVSGSFLQISN